MPKFKEYGPTFQERLDQSQDAKAKRLKKFKNQYSNDLNDLVQLEFQRKVKYKENLWGCVISISTLLLGSPPEFNTRYLIQGYLSTLGLDRALKKQFPNLSEPTGKLISTAIGITGVVAAEQAPNLVLGEISNPDLGKILPGALGIGLFWGVSIWANKTEKNKLSRLSFSN